MQRSWCQHPYIINFKTNIFYEPARRLIYNMQKNAQKATTTDTYMKLKFSNWGLLVLFRLPSSLGNNTIFLREGLMILRWPPGGWQCVKKIRILLNVSMVKAPFCKCFLSPFWQLLCLGLARIAFFDSLTEIQYLIHLGAGFIRWQFCLLKNWAESITSKASIQWQATDNNEQTYKMQRAH